VDDPELGAAALQYEYQKSFAQLNPFLDTKEGETKQL
jgi:hypothetical protein